MLRIFWHFYFYSSSLNNSMFIHSVIIFKLCHVLEWRIIFQWWHFCIKEEKTTFSFFGEEVKRRNDWIKKLSYVKETRISLISWQTIESWSIFCHSKDWFWYWPCRPWMLILILSIDMFSWQFQIFILFYFLNNIIAKESELLLKPMI